MGDLTDGQPSMISYRTAVDGRPLEEYNEDIEIPDVGETSCSTPV